MLQDMADVAPGDRFEYVIGSTVRDLAAAPYGGRERTLESEDFRKHGVEDEAAWRVPDVFHDAEMAPTIGNRDGTDGAPNGTALEAGNPHFLVVCCDRPPSAPLISE